MGAVVGERREGDRPASGEGAGGERVEGGGVGAGGERKHRAEVAPELAARGVVVHGELFMARVRARARAGDLPCGRFTPLRPREACGNFFA